MAKKYTVLGGLELELLHGSITDANVDVIVNAANAVLAHTCGIAAHISNLAGPKFDRYCKAYVDENGSIAAGGFLFTPSFNLRKFKRICNVVGPIYKRDKERLQID